MTKRDILMIFLKPFVIGKVKTRLAKSIGDQIAMEVYKTLIKHTVSEAQKLSKDDVRILFCYSEEPGDKSLFSENIEFVIQKGETLGDRMAFAMNWAEKEGYQKKVIIGSDCAEITTEIIKEAYVQLEQKDVVLGPAKDGGYYLIGLKKPSEAIFRDINWSTDTVYEATVQKIKDDSLSLGELQALSDIDDLEDLRTAPLFLRESLNIK